MSRRNRFSRENHEEEAFHNAIVEEPNNDTIKLIYADWLRENGNPHLGDLIEHASRGDQSKFSGYSYKSPVEYHDFHDAYQNIFKKKFNHMIGDDWIDLMERTGNNGWFERGKNSIRAMIPLRHKESESLPVNLHMYASIPGSVETSEIADGLSKRLHEAIDFGDRQVLIPPNIDRNNINKIIAKKTPVGSMDLFDDNDYVSPDEDKVRRIEAEIRKQQQQKPKA